MFLNMENAELRSFTWRCYSCVVSSFSVAHTQVHMGEVTGGDKRSDVLTLYPGLQFKAVLSFKGNSSMTGCCADPRVLILFEDRTWNMYAG